MSFQIDVHRLILPARSGWTLLFVRETWWSADRKKAIRDSSWTHLESGDRHNVPRWFQEREYELERQNVRDRAR